MTTQKQIEANLQNAQLSTGPTTVNGKAIVSTNAIKHGIFTKDLIVSSEIENENENDYQVILNNLVDCLSPCNQMESLLVEKIAVDFWRLRRTIRFETGSIAQGIKKLLHEFYSHGNQNNEKIDEEIRHKQELITWNLSYLECLGNSEVTFDQPEWKNNDINSDIIEDFYLIAKSIPFLTNGEKEMLYNSYDLQFERLRSLLIKYGYSEAKEISTRLIELYTQQNQRLENEIPIIDELTEKIKGKLVDGKILPKSKLREALGYFCGLIPYLKNYTKDAFARLDNNVAERAVRPLAIGRKNWLFFGSPDGGEAGAILLSLVQTCRGLGINPRDYLEDIMNRIMSHNSQKLYELLPDQWQKARQQNTST